MNDFRITYTKKHDMTNAVFIQFHTVKKIVKSVLTVDQKDQKQLILHEKEFQIYLLEKARMRVS